MTNKLSRFLPKFLRRSQVTIPVVRLQGPISSSKRHLSLDAVSGPLEKAFAKPSTKAVALVINSPGGSPVQSALIHDRIRQLAKKTTFRFWFFVTMLPHRVDTGSRSLVMKSMPMKTQSLAQSASFLPVSVSSTPSKSWVLSAGFIRRVKTNRFSIRSNLKRRKMLIACCHCRARFTNLLLTTSRHAAATS